MAGAGARYAESRVRELGAGAVRPAPSRRKNMYHVIIYGCPDEFAVAVHGRVFNRRGLIRFLSRHADRLVDYYYVAVSHDYGPASPINFWFVGKKHMNDCIPTNRHIRLKRMSDCIPTDRHIHLK